MAKLEARRPCYSVCPKESVTPNGFWNVVRSEHLFPGVRPGMLTAVMNTDPHQNDEFISEAIVPVAGTFVAAAMSRGEPGLPAQFVWRDKTYTVDRLLSTWKSSTPDGGELYLRRHWFSIQATTGEQMTLYCERQAKNPRKPKARWWLYTIRT